MATSDSEVPRAAQQRQPSQAVDFTSTLVFLADATPGRATTCMQAVYSIFAFVICSSTSGDLYKRIRMSYSRTSSFRFP